MYQSRCEQIRGWANPTARGFDGCYHCDGDHFVRACPLLHPHGVRVERSAFAAGHGHTSPVNARIGIQIHWGFRTAVGIVAAVATRTTSASNHIFVMFVGTHVMLCTAMV
ncbi:hypothetical protein niasHT_005139 [Heterodera trifolii]|uniref:Uncharacterized protein n=1 Tax=Heterodera trifolii TaxID=157864 RepID=A0ABD2MB37_9BILA